MELGADFGPCSQVKFNKVQGNNDPDLQLDPVENLLFDLIARLTICEKPHFWGLRAELGAEGCAALSGRSGFSLIPPGTGRREPLEAASVPVPPQNQLAPGASDPRLEATPQRP